MTGDGFPLIKTCRRTYPDTYSTFRRLPFLVGLQGVSCTPPSSSSSVSTTVIPLALLVLLLRFSGLSNMTSGELSIIHSSCNSSSSSITVGATAFFVEIEDFLLGPAFANISFSDGCRMFFSGNTTLLLAVAAPLDFTGVSSTRVTGTSFGFAGFGGGASVFALVVAPGAGLGFGLNVRDMLTSRLSTGFFGGAVLARSRAFCSWASETDRERERARANSRALNVGEGTCRAIEGARGRDFRATTGGSGSSSTSSSEKGDDGKTLDRRSAHCSGSSALNLFYV